MSFVRSQLDFSILPDILLEILENATLTETSQNRAIKNYRKRLGKRGMARFEVLGLESDRPLIRSLAKRLAKNDAESKRIRVAVRGTLVGNTVKKGGIFASLRRSPLVGADLKVERERTHGRKVEL